MKHVVAVENMQHLLHTCKLVHALILASVQFLLDTCISYWKQAYFIGHMHFLLGTDCSCRLHLWGIARGKDGVVRTWWARWCHLIATCIQLMLNFLCKGCTQSILLCTQYKSNVMKHVVAVETCSPCFIHTHWYMHLNVMWHVVAVKNSDIEYLLQLR